MVIFSILPVFVGAFMGYDQAIYTTGGVIGIFVVFIASVCFTILWFKVYWYSEKYLKRLYHEVYAE